LLTFFKTTERLSSLDAFRGFTIFFMNLVNNSEFVDGSISFKPFSHSDWNGVTIADLVMPFFLFIVGASIVLSHSKLQKSGVSRLELVKKAAIRSCKLFALGIFLQGASFPDYDLSTLRIPGVLQRIAITYFLVVLIELFVPKK
jgi:heparan-alpha-glucosaminide N-acetyltransferase